MDGDNNEGRGEGAFRHFPQVLSYLVTGLELKPGPGPVAHQPIIYVTVFHFKSSETNYYD